MKIKICSSLLGFLMMAVVWLPAQSAATEQPITAKTGLMRAQEKAKAWQADAVLIGINTMLADGQGKVSPAIPGMGWTYIFRSEKAQKNFVVTVGGGPIGTQETGPSSVKSIAEAFIDSEAAMAEAVKNGFTPASGDSNYMAVGVGLCQASLGSLCWKINAGQGEYFNVDGKTGKFLGKSPW